MKCACETVDIDEQAIFHSLKKPTAKKEHRCCECRRVIKPGEKYIYESLKWDFGFYIFKTCEDCKSIRDTIFCNGWYYEGLHEMLREYINELYGDVPSSCIVPLTSGAKNMVFELIEEVWEKYFDEV